MAPLVGPRDDRVHSAYATYSFCGKLVAMPVKVAVDTTQFARAITIGTNVALGP
jgi:hypothetical protein